MTPVVLLLTLNVSLSSCISRIRYLDDINLSRQMGKLVIYKGAILVISLQGRFIMEELILIYICVRESKFRLGTLAWPRRTKMNLFHQDGTAIVWLQPVRHTLPRHNSEDGQPICRCFGLPLVMWDCWSWATFCLRAALAEEMSWARQADRAPSSSHQCKAVAAQLNWL